MTEGCEHEPILGTSPLVAVSGERLAWTKVNTSLLSVRVDHRLSNVVTNVAVPLGRAVCSECRENEVVWFQRLTINLVLEVLQPLLHVEVDINVGSFRLGVYFINIGCESLVSQTRGYRNEMCTNLLPAAYPDGAANPCDRSR